MPRDQRGCGAHTRDRARVLLRRGMLEKTGAARASAFLFEKPRCDRVVAAALEGMGLAG